MKKLAIVALALVLTGCTAAIKGYPDTSLKDKEETYLSAEYPTVMDDRKITSVSTAAERNKIIDARLYLLDFQFSKFEKKLYRQGLVSDIGTDWLLLGIAAATATIDGAKTKEALGVASATVVGAKAAFDKRALLEKSVTALLAQMRADRAQVLVDIQTGANRDLDEYPLGRAIRDLDRYYQAGTLPNALNAVVTNASVQEAQATAAVKQLVKASYLKDESSVALLSFLEPGGEENAENYQAVRKWLGEHGYDSAKSAIPVFLYNKAEITVKDRQAMVRDLKVKDWLLKHSPENKKPDAQPGS